VILFLARLLSLPAETFEAARIDGARFWRLHRFVTVPQLAGVIAFYVVVEAITMVSWVFNYVYVISQGTGGPGDATMVSELYVYQSAFQYSAPDLAAAAAVILFAATLVLIAFFFRIQRRTGLAVD
jgi:ABC-type sugar transport system permease subunit